MWCGEKEQKSRFMFEHDIDVVEVATLEWTTKRENKRENVDIRVCLEIGIEKCKKEMKISSKRSMNFLTVNLMNS